MAQKSRTAGRLFLAAFLILTPLVWSPLGYGSYGPASRWLGMPSWAVVALGASALLFALEWYFLFRSGQALEDEEMSDLLRDLQAAGRNSRQLKVEVDR
ncbi:MAG: DUF997 domain-containing protein [Thermodesulfobacteriota bacterium]